MSVTHDYVELARLWRGDVVESTHRGVVVVSDEEGNLKGAWGNAGLVTYPRSSLKPFQAIPLVESGAADAFGLTSEHLALACASHHAEPWQVTMVEEWLGRLGMNEGALICGPALPVREADQAAAFAQAGRRRVYHNCSGKHCGFLTQVRHYGADINYAVAHHPAQIAFRAVLGEFTGMDADKMPVGVDGCDLPTLAMPMRRIAMAMARFGLGMGATPARRAAVNRLRAAMIAHPEHLAGHETPTARMVRACQGRLVLKGGAEGFLLAAVPERGLGFAIKMADGATRGKYAVLARMLGHFGVLGLSEAEDLLRTVEPPATSSNGTVTGRLEVVLETPVPTTPTIASLEFWMAGVKEALVPSLLR
jgi:L-asparaginase II